MKILNNIIEGILIETLKREIVLQFEKPEKNITGKNKTNTKKTINIPYNEIAEAKAKLIFK